MKNFEEKNEHSQFMNLELITYKSQLEMLAGHKAQFGKLSFGFSPEYIQKMKDLMDEKNALQLFAFDENKQFAGYVASAEKSSRPDLLWLVELFVEPKNHGQGVATLLCNEIIKKARELGLSGVITQTEFENVPAQKLYEKLGFMKIDNPDWPEGITYLLRT